MSSELVLVGAAASHLGTRLPNPYDSDGARVGTAVTVERLLLPMMTGNGGADANDLATGTGHLLFPIFLSVGSQFHIHMLSAGHTGPVDQMD